MGIAEFALTRRTITYLSVIILIGGGYFAYENLGRLEDPEYTIKEAIVTTEYPGATPEEVEKEVTDRLEKAIQKLGQIKRITSESMEGVSRITVVIKDQYDKATLPQVWDELRRKVNDAQSLLPPGVKPSIVNDDFGDVYGILLAISGDGYTYAEIKEYVDILERELLLVPEVAKVAITGNQPEVVYVEIARDKMATLGISEEEIYSALSQQNQVVPAGRVQVGDAYIVVHTTGIFKAVESIENVVIQVEGSEAQIYLKDIATVTRGYVDPPHSIIAFNGKPAIALGISTVVGGNVVRMGDAVQKRALELAAELPIGLEAGILSFQSQLVRESVNGFVINLLEALAIVIAVLFVFMGWRSGLLIGIVLLLTVAGTFLFMYIETINLERISLGALIIALGMLVDNAIVVTEGILIGVQRGKDGTQAAKEVVGQTMWPLFGATVVAILAFSGIGLSDDSTGEYCRSLFQVILISLMMSWLLAITITPFLCVMLFKPNKDDASSGEQKDPYAGFAYITYKGFLKTCINLRWLTVVVLVGLLFVAIYGYTFVKQSFFPDSTRTQFYVDYWLPEGMHVESINRDIVEVGEFIQTLEDVTDVCTIAGEGAPRFMLTYKPEKANTSYGFILISVDDYRNIDSLRPQIQEHIDKNFPNSRALVKKFVFGTGGPSSIEARFSGLEFTTLRELAAQAKAIIRENGGAKYLRDDWREKIPVLTPLFSEKQARNTGLSRPDVNNALQTTFSGRTVGIYREDDKLLPIISRPPARDRLDVNTINNVQVFSPMRSEPVPLRQLVTGFETRFEDSNIRRRNRSRTLTVQCDQQEGTAVTLLNQIKEKIEAIPMPIGYFLEWGGEYENSKDAQAGLKGGIILSFVFMIATIIVLFNAVRQPLIIFLTVPLAIIGVTAGLLITHQPFGFMALLGFLSLSGMLIKNAVVLIDQIDLEIREGKEPFAAILESSVSRMRPVLMAAVTTILGMIPLVFDAFFVSMAVTIMFGLGFATVLTLVFVPVLYSIFFRIEEASIDKAKKRNRATK